MMGLIVIVLFTALALYLISIYNRLVTIRNGARNAFAQIDVQLTRRHDLIPNLVEVAKGYLQHERNTLEAVIQAHSTAAMALQAAADYPVNSAAIEALADAENQLCIALKRLLTLADACPDLKADPNMRQLSEALATSENKVAFARQAYNDGVMSYNNAREVFPGNFVASTFDFRAMQLIGIDSVSGG
jgi:LemA protein